MMDSGDKTRQQISELADGELDASQAAQVLKRLDTPEARATWDAYHQIGDVLRADAMAGAVSADFSRRFAAKFAAEPVVLAPRRSRLSRIGALQTTLAAVAAASFGFFVAPSLFDGRESPLPAAGPAPMARVSHGSLLADAGAKAALRESADYLMMHQGSNPAMVGAAPLAHPAVLDRRTGQ